MLILPSLRPRLLMPVPRLQWYKPSAAQPKDQFGNDTLRTIFRLTARLSDGHIAWRGIFCDRDDADAFLWALASSSLRQEPALWRLPVPNWHPDIAPFATYRFTETDLITSTDATNNQTYNVPADWVDDGSSVECVSHGGNGGASGEECCETYGGGGGGGGGYAIRANVNLTPSGTATFHLEPGGSGTGTTNATWFNGATLAASSVGIEGAANGTPGPGGGAGAGASTTSSVGDTRRAGGTGGNSTDLDGGGGGGAAGPSAVGGNASGTTGGARGSGSFADGNTHNGAGGDEGVNGSNYGGGAGGADDSGAPSFGTGAQGIIVVTYTPEVGGTGNFFLFF